MPANDNLDTLFQEAVNAIDAGDVVVLSSLLNAHPQLLRDRLDKPGPWLTAQIDLEGFFREPYLLWFVAEDPVRNGTLPPNIADVAKTIISTARDENVDSLQEQLDYALRLVCWSWIARDSGVQIQLIDALLDAGASPDGRDVYGGRYGSHCESAIYNRNYSAAEHILARGATLTLSTALALGRWEVIDRLFEAATPEERSDAFVQSAMNGHAEALRRMLARGIEPTTVSKRNQSHGTALHHAVWSGSLEAVRVLIDAGADLHKRDSIYDGTPIGWAEHAERETDDESRKQQYREIASFLSEHAIPPS